MSGSGRETLSDVLEWSRGPSGYLEVVGRPSPIVWEWSGDPPECLGVVGRPSRMSWSGREALLDILKWSEGPPGCLGVAG